MAVFPDNMNKLQVDDVPGSLVTVEQYIGYIRERVEFAMKNVTRTVSEAGVSSVGLAQEVAQLANVVAAMAGTIGSMGGEITAVKGELAQVKEQIQTLEDRVTELEQTPEG